MTTPATPSPADSANSPQAELPLAESLLAESLLARAGAALAEADPDKKLRLVASIDALARDGLRLGANDAYVPVQVGRPAKPALVHPKRVPKRRLGSEKGHAALLHAVAHIEFNAINLAVDAAYRFRGMPDAYYYDWLRVAAEEAKHFALLRDYLADLGYTYGDFDAHDGLWAMAEQTADDVLIRMALVPRVLEARGLDVTPQMRARLVAINDARGVTILDVIAHDEVGHVRVGSHWFKWLCEQRGLASEATFLRLLKSHMPRLPKGPFARTERLKAGFSAAEMDALERADC